MILFVSNVSLLKENLFVRPFGLLYDDFGFIKKCMYYPKKIYYISEERSESCDKYYFELFFFVEKEDIQVFLLY